MAADVAATEQEWLIATWHHPPYTKGSHNSDTESQLREMRENALPILEAAGVDLVLAGHSHIYERSFLLDGAYETPSTTSGILDDGDGRPAGDGPYSKAPDGWANDGAIYIVAGHGGTGTGGSGDHPLMVFSELENGSVIIDVHENRLDIANIRYDGEITDRSAVIKGDGLMLISPNGGETLVPGVASTVSWATSGAIDSVDLDFSCDDGERWIRVADALPNAGTASWVPPELQSDAVRLRVSDTNSRLYDTTNGRLTISRSGGADAVSWGDEWRYDDQGYDHGESWLDLEFDDSGWSTGVGQFGYGDGDESTELYDESPNIPTVYFRKVITLDGVVAAPAVIEGVYDDGIAVWLNGQLVGSANIDDTAFDEWSQGSNDNEPFSTVAAPELFDEGQNVLAVMVKQGDPYSSDISFDLRMTVVLADPSAPNCDALFEATPEEEEQEEEEEVPGGGVVDEPRSCGCASTTPGTPWWLGGLVVIGLRHRRARWRRARRVGG